jgi:hypothetical protein
MSYQWSQLFVVPHRRKPKTQKPSSDWSRSYKKNFLLGIKMTNDHYDYVRLSNQVTRNGIASTALGNKKVQFDQKKVIECK